ncbi:MAG TPA: ABC transporter substrate-binding protein [Candidatus Acidoferrales bacterium]|nr:ABC transporter substrate-binding protein [Candidatus Acidoferrales bacterium]
MHKKLKVCSLLPGATRMIQDLGLDEYLYGVTFECPSDKPKVVRSYLEGNNYTSREIDQFVTHAKKNSKSLYYVDEKLLQEIEPDIIFTQEVCDVCQIETSIVSRAVYKLKKQPLIVPLVPRNLKDVYDNVVTIAKTLGKEENAVQLLRSLKKRTDRVLDTLRMNNAPLRRVMIMEWLSPIYNCGHWIPDQIAHAGGVDMLSNPAGYSIVTPWEKVKRYNPEVLVVAPCGFSIKRTDSEIGKLLNRQGIADLAAVKNNAVYLADANLFTCPSTQLVDGIELLASLFHPKLFPMHKRFADKYLPVTALQETYAN